MATKKQAAKDKAVKVEIKSPEQVIAEMSTAQDMKWRYNTAFNEVNDRLHAVREFIADIADEKLRNELTLSMVHLRDQMHAAEFARRQRHAQEFGKDNLKYIPENPYEVRVNVPSRSRY